MATVSYYTSETSKPWKAWYQALNEAGMPRTADTGQYDPNSTTLNGTTIYEVRTFQDYYIKFTIALYTSTLKQVTVEVGTGSNGSGTITGMLMKTRGWYLSSSTDFNTYEKLKVIYSANHVTIAMTGVIYFSSKQLCGFSFGVIDPGTSVETPVVAVFPITYTTSARNWTNATFFCSPAVYMYNPNSYLGTNSCYNVWWPGAIATQNSPVADQFPMFPLYAWRTDGQAVKIPWMKAVHANAPLIYEYQSVTVDGDTWQLPFDADSSQTFYGAGVPTSNEYTGTYFHLKLVTRIAES